MLAGGRPAALSRASPSLDALPWGWVRPITGRATRAPPPETQGRFGRSNAATACVYDESEANASKPVISTTRRVSEPGGTINWRSTRSWFSRLASMTRTRTPALSM